MSEFGNPWVTSGDEFYSLLGQCIAEWANVDDELFRIFRDCVGPYNQCAIIYYRQPGLDIRFGLTDEIVRSVFPPPVRKNGGHPHQGVKAWAIAIKGYDKLLSERRRIAHHPVQLTISLKKQRDKPTYIGTYPLAYPPPRSWYEIYVGQHEKLRENSSKLKPMGLGELRNHLIEVKNLRGRLLIFFHDTLTKLPQESRQSNPQSASEKSQEKAISAEEYLHRRK
jgi:hypothetical protein